MRKKYLIDEVILKDLNLKGLRFDTKEVEVLDYKTLKKMFEQHKDPVITIKEFIKANNLLIVKTIE